MGGYARGGLVGVCVGGGVIGAYEMLAAFGSGVACIVSGTDGKSAV